LAEEPSIAKQKWYSGIKTSKRAQFGKRWSMTSYRQIEANRRNALKSTGPKAEAGKQASRRNAVRHGLTAETVINALEDVGDYKSFEARYHCGL
jgi:hypothetical protein